MWDTVPSLERVEVVLASLNDNINNNNIDKK